MRRLDIDLERVIVIEKIQLEPIDRHVTALLCNTNEYTTFGPLATLDHDRERDKELLDRLAR